MINGGRQFMAKTFVTLSSLNNYNGKIKGVIDKKQEQLVGTDSQIVSFDKDGKAVSIDFEDVGEKHGVFITREEYDQLETDGLVEENKNYYIIGSPMATENQIANLQAQIDELKARLDLL
jgi:antitoxin component YwqK of YwqJK toxin-antitoxin module